MQSRTAGFGQQRTLGTFTNQRILWPTPVRSKESTLKIKGMTDQELRFLKSTTSLIDSGLFGMKKKMNFFRPLRSGLSVVSSLNSKSSNGAYSFTGILGVKSEFLHIKLHVLI